MRSLLKRLYNCFHVCQRCDVYSVTKYKNDKGIITDMYIEYKCAGLFCNKKIEDKII